MREDHFYVLDLFSGAGGGILAHKLAGWRTVCAVECDPYAQAVLVARQNDGSLEPFPIWSDVRSFDGRRWRGVVDCISGGFPCQDISVAGTGKGIDGERSGLWGEFARIIREVLPRFVLVENSPALTFRGLDRVLGDLAAIGYDAAWGVLGAADVGAPHKRDRLWIVAQLADADRLRELQSSRIDGEKRGRTRNACETTNGASGCDVADADRPGLQQQRRALADGQEHEAAQRGSWWATEPALGRMANGVAYRVDRLRALGNGQVPGVAALVFDLLTGVLHDAQA
jgi:DNA (cytosine-5)-methyltransferase 1